MSPLPGTWQATWFLGPVFTAETVSVQPFQDSDIPILNADSGLCADALISYSYTVVKAVRGMNVPICTKASNLVHRYIFTCWTQICREPKPIFNGVAILDDSKCPPSKNTFLHFWPTNSHRITNKTTFLGFSTPRNPILISE